MPKNEFEQLTILLPSISGKVFLVQSVWVEKYSSSLNRMSMFKKLKHAMVLLIPYKLNYTPSCTLPLKNY